MTAIKIIKQRLVLAYDKAKNLLVKSVKYYANDKTRVDSYTLKKADIVKLMALKNAETFAHTVRATLGIIAALKLDSKAYKAGLCQHVRYRSTSNRIAKILKRDNMQTLYTAIKHDATKKHADAIATHYDNAEKHAKKNGVKKTTKKTTTKKA